MLITNTKPALNDILEDEFTYDTLRTAIVKDSTVAKNLGCEMFDCVFRFGVFDPF